MVGLRVTVMIRTVIDSKSVSKEGGKEGMSIVSTVLWRRASVTSFSQRRNTLLARNTDKTD